ncbi:uncharacterized protein LOC122102767 isoform X2 [Dipodomys spectabilis]|uniref:uncharacterized protein LOC122102767 isoform X2 n=1 Tax=Dipodomys spectabilis TaxID=105255 RepID=UPI001C5402C6|nr:uncharacterized protein LOC122102767 isoform X2 [Dipodomys spectabilis]
MRTRAMAAPRLPPLLLLLLLLRPERATPTPTPTPAPTQGDAGPAFRNLRVDPAARLLTWDGPEARVRCLRGDGFAQPEPADASEDLEAAEPEETDANSYTIRNPPRAFSLQLGMRRALQAWGAWGPAQRVACVPASPPAAPPWLPAALGMLGAAGAALAALRFRRKLCPRVPEPRPLTPDPDVTPTLAQEEECPVTPLREEERDA